MLETNGKKLIGKIKNSQTKWLGIVGDALRVFDGKCRVASTWHDK